MENNIDKSDENPKFSHKSSRSWIGRGVPCRPPVRATRRADANRSFLTGGGNRQRKAIPAHYSDGAHKSLRGQPRRRRLQKVPRRVYYDSERSIAWRRWPKGREGSPFAGAGGEVADTLENWRWGTLAKNSERGVCIKKIWRNFAQHFNRISQIEEFQNAHL